MPQVGMSSHVGRPVIDERASLVAPFAAGVAVWMLTTPPCPSPPSDCHAPAGCGALADERRIVDSDDGAQDTGGEKWAQVPGDGFFGVTRFSMQRLSCSSKTRCTFYLMWDGKPDSHPANNYGCKKEYDVEARINTLFYIDQKAH